MTQLLANPITEALGWTLLHAVWEVGGVALLLYLYLLTHSQASPVLRYQAATWALLAVGILVAGTFIYEYALQDQPAENTVAQTQSTVPLAVAVTSELPTPAPAAPDLRQRLAAGLSEYAPALALLWLTGVMLFTCRLLGGMVYLVRLRQHPQNTVHPGWQRTAQRLSCRMGLYRPLSVVTSHLVRVPMVVGYLKPMILLPVSVVTSVPADQLEMILAHEVAHIYRRDHWVNLLQSVAEIILFYHPALWWISGVIRTEREYCCDDLALVLTGNTVKAPSLTLAKALLALEERRSTVTDLALAATGRQGSLLQRIERIVTPGAPRTANHKALAALVVAMVMFSAGVSLALSHTTSLTATPLSGIFQHTQSSTEFENAEQATSGPDVLLPTDTIPAVGRPPKPEAATDRYRPAALDAPSPSTPDPRMPNATLDGLWGEDLGPLDTLPAPAVSSFSADHEDMNLDLWVEEPHAPGFAFSFSTDTFPDFVFNDSLLSQLRQLSDSMMHQWGDELRDPTYQREARQALREVERHLSQLLDSLDHQQLQRQIELQQQALERQTKVIRRQAEVMKEQLERRSEQARERIVRRKLKDEGLRGNFESATHRLEYELQQDGFLTPGEQYTFKIRKGRLEINGEKQSEAFYQKYAALLRDSMDIPVEEGSNFSLIKEPYQQ